VISQCFFRHQGVAPYESRDAPANDKTDAAPPSHEMRAICYENRTNPSSRAAPNFHAGPRLIRVADSSSTNAVSFSSACTIKRFPSPRCASAIQIVRPAESIAENTVQTPSGLAEIIGDDLPILHVMSSAAPFCRTALVELYSSLGASEVTIFRSADRRYSNPISDLLCSGGITRPRCRSGLVPVRGREEQR
jgi:hypothetical protein